MNPSRQYLSFTGEGEIEVEEVISNYYVTPQMP